ncbi:hypothetical protein [uncultured Croceitalea sp.]|uniref:MORN repeat-containing protein n=1 Tax=uncultured Croceitalea sp. TaxID=1798908 RepID=UPI003306636A
MKKRLLIPYLLLGAAMVITIALFFRTSGLQKKLNETRTEQSELTTKIAAYEEMNRIDSLLLNGKYTNAITAYRELSNEGNDPDLGIPLRIKLVENLKNLNLTKQIPRDTLNVEDSIAKAQVATPIEIKRYDSLSFAHEKAKIQVARLRKLLQQKSSGEYLRFKSKKGNQLHYVGQVKHKKANGIGIALLDTGSRYEGEWLDNQRHGKGSFYWPDGEHYEGAYENDKRNGLGTYYWPNGEKYVGFWKDDKRNGHGEFYGTDGSVVTSGTWKDDKLVETDEKEKRTRR